MNLLYKSTRDAEKTVTASQAILKGLADDGGLFVPVSIPKLPVSLGELKEMTYQEIAYTVMKEFLTDFTEEELKSCIAKAYDSKFDTEEIAPLAKVEDAYYLEKPILFYQFDLKQYNETNGSYVNMEKDLFGDRCTKQNELVRLIREYTENGFQEKPAYAAMRNNLFVARDHDNCKRTYEYIKSQGY